MAAPVDAGPHGTELVDTALVADEADKDRLWAEPPPAQAATLVHDAVRSAAAQEEYRRLMESIVAPLAMGGLGTAGGLSTAGGPEVGGNTATGALPAGPCARLSAEGDAGFGRDPRETGGYAARYLQQRKGSEGASAYTGAAARPPSAVDAAADADAADGGHPMRVSPPRLGLDRVGTTGAREERVGVHRHAAGTSGSAGHGIGHSLYSRSASPGRDPGLRTEAEDRWAVLQGGGWDTDGSGGWSRSLSPGVPVWHVDAQDGGPGAAGPAAAAGSARACPPPAIAAAACSYSISNACSVRPAGPAAVATCVSPEVRHVRPQSAGACMHGRSNVGCLDARRPSPVPRAACAAVPDLRELMTQREALLEALERERRDLVATQQRAQEAEADLQERSMTYEVQPLLNAARHCIGARLL